MIESVSVEMCDSVIESPPIRLPVVDVNSPVISWCLMNDVSPMTNSRNAFDGPDVLERGQAVERDALRLEVA